jgi:hypothetical protein
MPSVGVGFHTDAFVADVEIGDHQRTCRSWSKTSLYCIVTAKAGSFGREAEVENKGGEPDGTPGQSPRHNLHRRCGPGMRVFSHSREPAVSAP